MSIEQKIAQILAESNADDTEMQATEVETEEETEYLDDEVASEETVQEEKECDTDSEDDSEDEVMMKKENMMKKQKMKKEEVETEMTIDVQEDVAALVNGEDLSEEFKTKAATIFEAAIVSRVKQELTRIEEEFEAQL